MSLWPGDGWSEHRPWSPFLTTLNSRVGTRDLQPIGFIASIMESAWTRSGGRKGSDVMSANGHPGPGWFAWWPIWGRADGKMGLWVSPCGPGGMADAIRRLLTGPADAAPLGQNARLRVERDFSMSRMVEEYDNLHQRCLNTA